MILYTWISNQWEWKNDVFSNYVVPLLLILIAYLFFIIIYL